MVVFVVVEFVKVDACESFLCVSKKNIFFLCSVWLIFLYCACVCVGGTNFFR